MRSLPSLAFNVPSIARKTVAEVERILGRPDKSSSTWLGGKVKYTYHRGAIEVVFVDGKAAWIKIFETHGLPFSSHALAKLGLPPRKPTYVNRDRVMSWGNICNLKEVSLYSGGANSVSYVLVCAQAAS